MQMVEIVPRINSCLFATERDDSAIFMIIYHHMMRLDILLSQYAGHTLIDLFRFRKVSLGGQ